MQNNHNLELKIKSHFQNCHIGINLHKWRVQIITKCRYIASHNNYQDLRCSQRLAESLSIIRIEIKVFRIRF